MAGLSVVVEPGEAGFFAGESVHVRITFRNDRRDAAGARRASASTSASASASTSTSTSASASHVRAGSVLDLQTNALSSSFRLAPTSASVPASPVTRHGASGASGASGNDRGDADAGADAAPASPLYPHTHARVVPRERGTQQLLWAYAQLSGSFSVDPALLKPFDFELVKQRIAQGSLHADTAPGRAVGGGELIPGSMAEASGRLTGNRNLAPGHHGDDDDGDDDDSGDDNDDDNDDGDNGDNGDNGGGHGGLSAGRGRVGIGIGNGTQHQHHARGALPPHASLDSLVLGLGLPSPLDRSVQDEQLYAKLTGARPPRRVRSVSVAHLGGGFPTLEERSDGWTAYLRNRLTLGAGVAPRALPQGSEGDWARVSPAPYALHGLAHRRTGSTLADKAASTVLAREIPTLSMPPSVLCVDLALRPGESRSFDLSIPLPPDLPPSYMGTSISFTYTLSIGTNRLVGARQRSNIVQIPIRVFTHVPRGGEPPFWDLLNPIIWLTDHGVVAPASASPDAPVRASQSPQSQPPSTAAALAGGPTSPIHIPESGPEPQQKAGRTKAERLVTRADLEAYAHTLLAGAPLPPPAEEGDEHKSCLDNADVLTRTSPKGTSVHVCILHARLLERAKWRLTMAGAGGFCVQYRTTLRRTGRWRRC